jgi:diadenosine tetraphosphatase ApaH/serine/threonine PP2A family protein phosphatase
LRYAIISDLHANLEALKATLARIDAVGVDLVVCLGDVVGYNANPNECIDLVRGRDIPTVCGNHDAVACGLVDPWGFNPVALSAALWTRETLRPENLQWLKELPDIYEFEHFLAVHGSPTDRDNYLFTWEEVLPYIEFLEERNYSLCFFGHTHYPGIFSADGVYTVDENSKFPLGEKKTFFINPGSVGQPRDGDPRAAFGILDTEKREYELVRVEYDVHGTAHEIIGQGLPHFLAERLFVGR